MPNNGEVSSYTGIFRLASLSDPNRRVIKRNRLVVSCVPCRNRKLKCDRQQPCASCVKRHDETSCKFHVGPGGGRGGGGGGGGGDSGSGSAGVSRQASPVPRREMQTKLAMLENLVQGFMSQSQSNGSAAQRELGSTDTSRSGASPAGSSAPSAATQTPAGVGGGHLSRDGKELRFVGATNYQAVLECLRDLQGCVEATESPAPTTATSLRQREGPANRATAQLFAPEASITTREVMDHLPPRVECDGILTFYFQQTYMVPVCIHTGQFQRAYERFWQAPHATSLLWISLLFSILSTSVFQQASKNLGSSDGSNTLAVDTREKIAGFSSMAYRCLLAGDYILGKPYSVEATFIFGIHLVLQKRDTEPICWHTIGTAVRLAQRMGYHRDASHLSRNSSESAISPFEGEMRRRVWAYLEYFDVVYSFQHGVPPIIHGDMVDTKLPSNLRDEEFNEDISALPHTRSSLELTPILVFIFGARQVKLLRCVIQQALAVKPPSYGDVRLLDDELRSLHEDVPPCLRYRAVRESGFADVPDVIMRRMLCEVLYLKCVCVLHRRYLTFGGSMYESSRQACCDASLRLLDIQAEFDEHSGEGGRLYEKRYMFTNPTGHHDFLLAAMCICLDLMNRSHNNTPEDHERKVNALKRALTIWSKTAHRSKEAAHATNVLENILSKVFPPETRQPSARPPPTDGGKRFTASANTVASGSGSGSGSGSSRDDTDIAMANSEAPLVQPRWSAVNNSAPAEKAPLKTYSMEWNYEWLDNIGKRKDQTIVGALDSVLTDGVDWNRIDSLLLGREHTTGTNTMPEIQSDDSHPNQKASKEGWPYIRYGPEQSEGGSSTNFRTWARAGISLAGFGPSSSDSTFL